jgi:phospholipase/carboxylesterase
MATPNLSGPRLAPASGKATHLVVLCHGYGADGNDLIGLAQAWRAMLPTVAFVAPNAPERCAAGPGYQWFPISKLEPDAMRGGVMAAGGALDRFLTDECARLGLADDRLALVGFSQGTMLALHVGLSRDIAGIVGYSGLAVSDPAPRPEGFPPVLLVHGDADPLVPPDYLFDSAIRLGRAGVGVQWHLSAGLAHGIDEPGLVLGGQFLSLALRGSLQPKGDALSCALA